MKIVGNVNNVHEKAKPQPLKLGEVVVYQILAGIVNPDNTQRARVPMLYPESFTIPTKDRIKTTTPDEKEGYVDIAVVESFQNIPGTNQFDIRPKKLAIPRINNGYFYCTGGNIADEEIYEFCEMTDFNASKEGRDESKPAYFKRVDVQKDSKDRSKKRSILLEAMKAAAGMTNGEVKEFASSMNKDENQPIEILRDWVEDFAQKEPQKFSDAFMAKDRDVKTIIKRAVDSAKISYDSQQHRIALGTQTLIKLDRTEGVDWLTQAAEYCLHNKNGEKVLSNIKKLLSAE